MTGSFIQNKEIIQSFIDKEVMMLDVKSGYYFSLNSVGTDIWRILEKEITFNQIIDYLMEKYNIDINTCKRDTEELLEMMLEKGIILKVI